MVHNRDAWIGTDEGESIVVTLYSHIIAIADVVNTLVE